MPSGLVFVPSAFGIRTRFTGWALYCAHLWLFSLWIAFHFCSSLVHKILSIPGVFPPLLVVTLLIAKALAANEVMTSLCISRITTSLLSDFNAPYSFACNAFNSALARFQSIIFQLLNLTFIILVSFSFSGVLTNTTSSFRLYFFKFTLPNRSSSIGVLSDWSSLYVRFACISKSAYFRMYQMILCRLLPPTIRFLDYSSARWLTIALFIDTIVLFKIMLSTHRVYHVFLYMSFQDSLKSESLRNSLYADSFFRSTKNMIKRHIFLTASPLLAIHS